MSPSLPRPLGRLGVVVLALLTVLAAALAGAGAAAAHVSVSSTDAAAGGSGKLTFRVPNESDTASTVALRISIPEEFALSGGPSPDSAQLAFPAVQTYSDGTEAAWIEPTVAGQAEPERPAPVLTLSAAGTAADTGHGTTTTPADTAAAATTGHADAGPGALAPLIAIAALFTGLAGVVLGWRAGRRTVSS